MVREIEPQRLAELRKSRRVLLLDVREPEEHELVRIEGSLLIPLGELADRVSELRTALNDPHDVLVVYCRVGGRSALAAEWLEEHGCGSWYNLRGGINAWACEVDSSLEPY